MVNHITSLLFVSMPNQKITLFSSLFLCAAMAVKESKMLAMEGDSITLLTDLTELQTNDEMQWYY